jgi:hypothetical protein
LEHLVKINPLNGLIDKYMSLIDVGSNLVDNASIFL